MPRWVLNTLIMIIALLLAVLLWFNAVAKKEYEYELTLPVTGVDFPPGLGPVTPLPESLHVRLLATGKKLLHSDWKRSGLHIKAMRLRRGANTLDLNLETVSLTHSDNVTLLDLSGMTAVPIYLDRIEPTTKPIAARLTVKPADGYITITGQDRLDPSRVAVIGPEILLKQIDSIYTEQRIIDQATSSVEISLALEEPSGMPVKLASDSTVVTVKLDKKKTRRIDNLPIVAAIDVPSKEKITFVPDHISIEIEGPQTIIDTLSSSYFKIRLTGNPAAGYVRPEVFMPPVCRFVRMIPDSVEIQVSQ